MKIKLAVLGTGNMGSALAGGALKIGVVKPTEIFAFDIDKKRLQKAKRELKIQTVLSNIEAVKKSSHILVCVKPQQMPNLLNEIKKAITADQCLISIAAGISTQSIEKVLSLPVPVIRVMPNTPALIQSGVSVIAQGKFSEKKHLEFAKRFFSSIGSVTVLREKYFDAVTAVSGSGPAYLFYLAESLEKTAQKLGLTGETAKNLVYGTFFGASKMLMTGISPQELRKQVTSPGGTTEAAICHLEKMKWREIFEEAVLKAKKRSEELRLNS